MNKLVKIGAVLAGMVVMASPAWSAEVLLDFEGLQDNEFVQDFYNGGNGSLGSGPGPNSGVVFDDGLPNRALVVDAVPGAPSPSKAITLNGGTQTQLSYAQGFNQYSFYHTSFNAGSYSVYSNADGTGTLLDSGTLASAGFGTWQQVSGNAGGVAKSIVFNGLQGDMFFDNVTLAPVPEPGTLLLLGTGLVGIVAYRRRIA